MKKPTRYCVEYWDSKLVREARSKYGEDFDPADVVMCKNFESLESAQAFFAKCVFKKEGPMLLERVDLRDVTPEEDPPGLLWGWDTKMLAD